MLSHESSRCYPERVFNIEALVLLEGDLEAQRLVATWANVQTDDDLSKTYDRWSEMSGVDIDDVQRLAPVLFQNGILGPEGFAEERALQFIRARVASRIGAR